MSVGSHFRGPLWIRSLHGTLTKIFNADGSLAAIPINPTLVTASVGVQVTPTAVTATADGLTTGLIPAGTGYATITSGNADHIATLPAPVVGAKLSLFVGATGCELRSSAPASIGINGGVGAGAESALAANTVVHLTCVSLTAWRAFQQVADGTLAKTEVAA